MFISLGLSCPSPLSEKILKTKILSVRNWWDSPGSGSVSSDLAIFGFSSLSLSNSPFRLTCPLERSLLNGLFFSSSVFLSYCYSHPSRNYPPHPYLLASRYLITLPLTFSFFLITLLSSSSSSCSAAAASLSAPRLSNNHYLPAIRK